MKNRLMALGLLGVVGFVACGDDKPPLIDLNNSGSAGKFAKPSSGGEDAGGGGGDDSTSGGKSTGGSAGKTNQAGEDAGGADAGGAGGEASFGAPPTVTVLSPAAVTNPVTGNVLIGDSVNVLCRAVQSEEAGASAVDPASVKVAILDADGALISEKDAASAGSPDEYQGDVPLTLAETGEVTIRCSARSLGNALGTDENDTFVDHGPKLTLKTPLDGDAVGLKDLLKVQFEALPVPLLMTGDTEAAVASVSLSVAGVTVATTPVGGMPNTYEASVNLDGNAFDPKPNGNTSVTIRATNGRTPTAVTAVQNHQINVDGVGPIIATTQDKDVVGGLVGLTFSVTDTGSGVNADSVAVILNNERNQYAPGSDWDHPAGTDSFTYKFDSRDLTAQQVVQIAVEIEAEDNVGNAALPQTLTLFLDNVAPMVDLDPADLRVKQRGSPFYCSASFDPVGSLAANDDKGDGNGDVSSGQNFFRALVWEQTNFLPGPADHYYIGTDTSSVRLYVHSPADAGNLLINSKTPGSGTCDEIGDKTSPRGLSSISGGAPWYTQEASFPGCTFPPSPTTPPTAICNGFSDLYFVISRLDSTLSEPAVYADSPEGGALCDGIAWEYTSFVDQDGWMCFAARAEDNLKNVGVSPPLRICVDRPSDPTTPSCALQSETPPSCTDGCTPPARGGGFIASVP